MIIKSHVRGGYRSAAEYLKDQGENEKTRLVEISDPSARNLDEAFHNMWVVASNTRCTKPLHHISINPMKDERLADKQVLAIVERCEQKYGYKQFHHQRVIVEHIKDGRQHFHVIWNRVSLVTGRPVWPGQHWNKSKQVCREMEKELGLKRPTPNRTKRALNHLVRTGRVVKSGKGYFLTTAPKVPAVTRAPMRPFNLPANRRPLVSPPQRPNYLPPVTPRTRRRKKKNENEPVKIWRPIRTPEMEAAELLAWAFENGRWDILAQYGIFMTQEYFEP